MGSKINYILVATLGMFLTLALFDTFISYAEIAGEWTQCIGRIPGKQWNIVNGQDSEESCIRIGKKCVNDPRYEINYYSKAVIINAPYERCTLK